nr:N-6 DNA methylase [uncultured Draconibacterium sp.]
MSKENFRKYLINLGFTEAEISSFLCENIFKYSPSYTIPEIQYIFTEDDEEIFKYHLKLWNRNSDNVFVAVAKHQTYIIDCKKKPQNGKIQSIKTFNYGVNSTGFEGINLDLISKNYIDSSYFFQFIQQSQRKKEEVDKDLLLNLIALRNDLLEGGNEQIVHLIILRCLFVKYLEDRGIFTSNYLSEILASKSVNSLIAAFGEVCKINGDVFGGNRLTANDIREDYLEKLHLFFSADYQSGQGTLFPYQFNNIPIQLISHVYEAFLNDNTKKGKGVYYTPSFVVNFMLSQSLKQKAEANPYLTVLDPSVGSAAFLVESFKIIRDAQAKKLRKNKLSYDEKKLILLRQLWGVDIDSDALQISAFSLYLALLEDESSEFIRKKIENSSPILPSLIGSTLMHANTIVDHVFEGQTFDFIVSNPPWGSVPNDGDKEHLAEREAIDNKSGVFPEYNEVADYERSQAFLRRIERWQKPDTTIVMIVKNSIFLNDKAAEFRKEFISKNKLETFYELSGYNKILFKKRTFKSAKVTVEIGASEPCAIAVFKPNIDYSNYKINYIAPKLTTLAEHFEIIQYTNNESFLINKSKFIENDILWRVLVNSDMEGFDLINKKVKQKCELQVEARSGFKPKKNMRQLGNPIWKKKIEPQNFEAYYLRNKILEDFNWNQELERRRNDEIFRNSRILVPMRPLSGDKLKLRGLHIKEEVIYKHNITSLKLKKNESYLKNNFPYLSIINSKLIGFYFFNISTQWGKGAEKRETLRNVDLETLPIIEITNQKTLTLITNKINTYIKEREEGQDGSSILNDLDENVYNLYELNDYEKEIINEFYQVKVERASDKLKFVQPKDIQAYFDVFKESFELILAGNHTLNATYSISQNIGAIIKITIVEKASGKKLQQDNALQVLHFVKNKQLKETDKLLKEEKIKVYEPTHFYLIKSNQFKDWTKRQALKDAKEEIDLLFSNLPDTNE